MTRSRRIAPLLVLAALLPASLSALPAAATPAPATDVGAGALFNDPHGTTAQQDAIRDHIINLINATPAGSIIRVALYHLNDAATTNALVAAHAKGVEVRLVLDYTSRDMSAHSYATLAGALGTDTAKDSWITTCPQYSSCLGPKGTASDPDINHNKFWLFSTSGDAKRVVVQSSSNMTQQSYDHLYNNAYTIVAGETPAGGPDTIYDIYRDHFTALTAADRGSWHYTSATADPYKAYFFPKADDSDTVVGILDNITCTYTAGGTTRHTAVKVAMFTWNRPGLAATFTALAKAGCDVDIVYSAITSSDAWNSLHPATGAHPDTRCYLQPDPADPGQDYYVHSKYLLVSGDYLGDPAAKIVFTGSHNYTEAALHRNDETLLKISDGTAYDAYQANFAHVQATATPGAAETRSLCQGQPFDD